MLSKLRQARHCPIYKFGYQVPRNHKEAIDLDIQNRNTKWHDAEQLELNQLDEYDVFQDKGKAVFDEKRRVVNTPTGHEKIRVHMIYDVKHDGRHKARLLADGHLTKTPIESVYSGLVSLWGADMGIANPADALSKHWGFASVWPVLKPLLYWKGNTQECPDGIEIFPPHT
jgi:hypothetical protein